MKICLRFVMCIDNVDVECYTFFKRKKERVDETGLPSHRTGWSGIYDD